MHIKYWAEDIEELVRRDAEKRLGIKIEEPIQWVYNQRTEQVEGITIPVKKIRGGITKT